MNKNVILYDDNCRFCISVKNHLEKNNTDPDFQLIGRNSEKGIAYINKMQPDKKELNSIIFIQNDRTCLTRSAAILSIMKRSGKYKAVYYLIKLFPGFLRDFGYNIIAWSRKYF